MRPVRHAFVSLVLAAAASQAPVALAATITWQAPSNGTGNVTDIVTAGTLVGAATSGTTTTVNGVSFQGISGTVGTVTTYGTSGITLNNLAVPSTSSYSSVPGSWDANYAVLVGSGGYGNPGSVTMTLSGLTIGDIYELQIFEPFWNNNWATNYTGGGSISRNANLSGPNVGVGSSNVPQYLIGTFKADGVSQSLTLNSPTQYVVFGSAQVRDLGVSPEPSSIALLGTGVLGVAGTLRRRKTA